MGNNYFFIFYFTIGIFIIAFYYFYVKFFFKISFLYQICVFSGKFLNTPKFIFQNIYKVHAAFSQWIFMRSGYVVQKGKKRKEKKEKTN